jgi:hypothetical protein
MSLEIIFRSLMAAIWGPPKPLFTLDGAPVANGGSAAEPPFAGKVCIRAMGDPVGIEVDAAALRGLLDAGMMSVVRCDGGSAPTLSPIDGHPMAEWWRKQHSFMGCDGDAPAGKPDGRMGVTDQAGQPAPVDDHMAASASFLGAFADVFPDNARRLRFERAAKIARKRRWSPWNPWESGL